MTVNRAVVVAGAAVMLLASCAPIEGLEYDSPMTKSEYRRSKTVGAEGGIFSGSGLSFFDDGEQNKNASGSPIPVNSFLWRATLDTLSFMPLASADPFGGVIITDWFAPPETIDERFKMTVYILSRSLRSDGLKVAVFRQTRDEFGNWVDGEVTEGTARQLEDGILSRARELRVAGLAE
ncbi:MAG: DUF3576 domain-containing protein [Alphaproteobacteria bacterium]